jgi:hypothetical protein
MSSYLEPTLLHRNASSHRCKQHAIISFFNGASRFLTLSHHHDKKDRIAHYLSIGGRINHGHDTTA